MSNEIQKVQNVMTGTVAQNGNNSVMASSANAKAIATVQAALVVAQANPRDTAKAVDRILNDCMRKGLAETATYQYARGGTNITGPSIRLAECMAMNWGNMDYGFKEIENTGNESVVEAFAWDLETNTKRTAVFTVPHARFTKRNGLTMLKDPRDIYEMIANQSARRVRACILAVIPGDVAEMAVNQCQNTLAANVNLTNESITLMLDKFSDYGVTREQIEERIQRKLDAITPAQFLSLRNIFNSLKDGMSKPKDWFDNTETSTTQEKSLLEKPAQDKKTEKKSTKKQSKAEKAMKDAEVEHQVTETSNDEEELETALKSKNITLENVKAMCEASNMPYDPSKMLKNIEIVTQKTTEFLVLQGGE
ncbi:hypothetical protein AAEX28_07305 [Lentisphaerota bacterium WC36G]|nr:hypothetical protein LJT99_10165 [Lentisphaerae bacterium WC36]